MKHLPASHLGRFLKRGALGIVFAVSFLGTAAAEDVFEGRVKMKMSAEGEQQAIDYFVKGERMRVEMNDPRAQGGAMILHMKEKKMFMLVPSQKMYMTMPLPDLTEGGSEQKKPESTGETKKILGYEAEKYVIEEAGNEYEVWATDELGTFGGLHLPGGEPGGASPTERALAGQKFFPLLIVERKGGREASRVEVTEIERKELADSLFEPPSDFRGMEMPFQAPR